MRLMRREPEPLTLLERILERVPVAQIKERIPIQMKPEPPSRLRRAAPLIGAGVTGAAIAYLFDPTSGRERRAKARGMVATRMRRTNENLDNTLDIRDVEGAGTFPTSVSSR
jgi:hypothetical protein